MATEKTLKFKIWATIEEMYLDEDGVEQHRDREDLCLPVKIAEFNKFEDAVKFLQDFET